MRPTFDESKARWASRCCECGESFAEGDAKRELALGHAMHEACYQRTLERCLIGSGDDCEDKSALENERAAFLGGTTAEVRLAYDRTSALFGPEVARKLWRLVWHKLAKKRFE
jgi:hypothetical protein